jgi:pimeloyl-ACP methyl ester carboxylesterase
VRETVVLVHGLLMAGLELLPLSRRLSRAGFSTRVFRYSSLKRSPSENAVSLHAFLRLLNARIIHLVGHSLGGIVILHLFDAFPDQKPGRVLLLGSPINGSCVAARLSIRRFPGRLLLGRSTERGLLGETPGWRSERPLAMIAGNLSMGAGRFIEPALPKPNDGVVALCETESPQIHKRLSVPSSHSGMLFSAEVAKHICRYLKTGELD